MLTYGELRKSPGRIKELGQDDVIVAARGNEEVVIQESPSSPGGPQATVMFQHETIRMMMAQRAERSEKLRSVIDDNSAVIPIRKRADSVWDNITVGRAGSVDIVLDDPAVSNAHAHFELDLDDVPVSVQDQGSSNGTFVNGDRLQPHMVIGLRSGDVVRFGQSIFYYLRNSTLRELLE